MIDIFPWNHNFDTGVAEIDDQHRKLVQILNDLAGCIAFNVDYIEVGKIIDSLVEYTAFHFTYEEGLWDKYLSDDPGVTDHKKVHQEFINEVKKFQARQKIAAVEVLAEEILGFLTKWLAAHILESDRFLAYKVMAVREGNSLADATQIAKDKMSGATKRLIEIILNIYDSLSTNTLRLMRELVERRMHEEVLSKSKRALEDLNANLERKVEERTQELKNKNAELESALNQNKALVRVLSHDLGNTIMVISSSSKLARTNADLTATENKNHWDRVSVAVAKQQDLVSYVRELVAVKDGKRKVVNEPVNLTLNLNQALFMLSERIKAKNLTVSNNVSEGIFVQAERVSLENSVFGNILSNAIKFSRPGGAIVITQSKSISDLFVLTIADSGIGIPSELLKNLFNVDVKTTRPGTSGEAGTGFGMPLVQMYMEAYGGNIQVESVPEDQGATSGQSPGTKIHLSFRIAEKKS